MSRSPLPVTARLVNEKPGINAGYAANEPSCLLVGDRGADVRRATLVIEVELLEDAHG